MQIMFNHIINNLFPKLTPGRVCKSSSENIEALYIYPRMCCERNSLINSESFQVFPHHAEYNNMVLLHCSSHAQKNVGDNLFEPSLAHFCCLLWILLNGMNKISNGRVRFRKLWKIFVKQSSVKLQDLRD